MARSFNFNEVYHLRSLHVGGYYEKNCQCLFITNVRFDTANGANPE